MNRALFAILLLWVFVVRAWSSPIPEAAQKHLAGGEAAIEMSTNEEGYREAVKEFEAAVRAAPDWSTPYYNIGLVYSKLNDNVAALRCFKKYLELAPNAQDSSAVKQEIYKLEYKGDVAKKNRFNGIWATTDTRDEDDLFIVFVTKGENGSLLKICFNGQKDTVDLTDVDLGKPFQKVGKRTARKKKQVVTECDVSGRVLGKDQMELQSEGFGKKSTLRVERNFIDLVFYKEVGRNRVVGDHAPFKNDDILTRINGEKFKFANNGELNRYLEGLESRSPVTLTLWRWEGEGAGRDENKYEFVVVKP